MGPVPPALRQPPPHYDQIAWFTDGSALPALDLDYTRRGGIFDFVPYIMHGRSLRDISWKISDHYPLWAEFLVRTQKRPRSARAEATPR